MFNVIDIGWNYSHPNGMLNVDKYDPPGSYVLILFKSPTIAVINGVETDISPNGMILFPPDVKRCFHPKNNTADPDGMWSNDYIIFIDSDGSAKNVISSITPLTPFYPDYAEHISEVIKELSELLSVAVKSPETLLMVNNRLEYIFLFILFNAASREDTQLSDTNAAVIRIIKQVRTYVMENPELQWDVGMMAKRAGVSQSYFFKVYRNIFGTSPMKDLTSRRIEKAKYYLSCTVMSVKEAAFKVGYANEYYFNRAFKNTTGMTPGNYCKIHQNNDTSNVLYINEKNK